MGVLHSTTQKPAAGGTIYDVYDGAYEFTDGLQRFELQHNDVNTAIGSGEFTLIMCYEPDSFGAIDSLFSLWQSSGNNRSFWARFVSSGSYLQVYTSAAGTGTSGAHRVAHGMSINTWYMWGISVSMSEAAQNDKIKIFRDGVDLAATKFTGTHSSINAPTYDSTSSTTRNLTSYKWGGRSGGGNLAQALDGFSHEWTVLDTPLTASEHLAIWNGGTPLSPRDSHDANVISRVNSDSGVTVGTDIDFDDDILGAGTVQGLNTIPSKYSTTGGIY